MIDITIRKGLPFVTVTLLHQGAELTLTNVLLDTGSYSTLFAIESVAQIGLKPEANDILREALGVGGSETVIEKRIQSLRVDTSVAKDFLIHLGAMDYGLELVWA